MRSFILLALVLTLAGGLAACGGQIKPAQNQETTDHAGGGY
ncbi:hypothetical protein GCM10011611_29110 [Aliidongia dinghuensis]|uniref:Uncharacterized protein n=1 Tax=Aliidongia dinghuensis TaxID=1867774 RepID=A0A8J3E5E7_9PROT|nr:hypothetical protein [Aliidongia dinghuensis]GGF21198.1 hypothetical protein GCM10011611_29110 [Aliidongia dinghuensis]